MYTLAAAEPSRRMPVVQAPAAAAARPSVQIEKSFPFNYTPFSNA